LVIDKNPEVMETSASGFFIESNWFLTDRFQVIYMPLFLVQYMQVHELPCSDLVVTAMNGFIAYYLQCS